MITAPRMAEGRLAGLRKARIERAIELALGEGERLRREREWLLEDHARLTREVARLTELNDELRESAEIWIRMYENALARANRPRQEAEADV
jgi:phage shock protein A